MVDLKYHLLTLTAIFLALTVGIVIGMALPGTEIFSEQQQTALADLEHNFTRLKTQTSQQEEELVLLRSRLRTAEELGQLVYPLLVRERLAGVKVGIIANYYEANDLDPIREAMALAGAEPMWELGQEQLGTAQVSIQTWNQPESNTNNNDQALIPVYTKDMLLPVHKVVLVGPFPKELLPSLKAVKQSLLTADVDVIGVQVQTGLNNKPFFLDLTIPGVDNVGSPAGLISMVALLTGEKGHFGNSLLADSCLPTSISQWINSSIQYREIRGTLPSS